MIIILQILLHTYNIKRYYCYIKRLTKYYRCKFLLLALILKMENKSVRITNHFKGNIIILVKNELELTGVYTIEQHKTEVEKKLLDRTIILKL